MYFYFILWVIIQNYVIYFLLILFHIWALESLQFDSCFPLTYPYPFVFEYFLMFCATRVIVSSCIFLSPVQNQQLLQGVQHHFIGDWYLEIRLKCWECVCSLLLGALGRKNQIVYVSPFIFIFVIIFSVSTQLYVCICVYVNTHKYPYICLYLSIHTYKHTHINISAC